MTVEDADTAEPVEPAIPDLAPASVEQDAPTPQDTDDAPPPPRLVSVTRPQPRRRGARPANSRGRSDALTDEEALTRGHAWLADNGGELPTSRRKLRDVFGCGDDRNKQLAARLAAELTTQTETENVS